MLAGLRLARGGEDAPSPFPPRLRRGPSRGGGATGRRRWAPPQERLTSKEAQEHAYFAVLKNKP